MGMCARSAKERTTLWIGSSSWQQQQHLQRGGGIEQRKTSCDKVCRFLLLAFEVEHCSAVLHSLVACSPPSTHWWPAVLHSLIGGLQSSTH
jgi:hypothetical protein